MKHLPAGIFLLLAISAVSRASDGTARDSARVEGPSDVSYGTVWSGLGAGIGMDYGGFGVNYTAFVSKNVGFFAGLGFAYSGIGYNFGAKIRMIPGKETSKFNPFVMGMWGYNAVFTASGESQTTGDKLSKTFHGITAGIGTDFRAKPDSKGYWSVAVLVPFQYSSLEDDDVKYYKVWLTNNGHGDYQTWVHSIAFSIGYHWIIRSK